MCSDFCINEVEASEIGQLGKRLEKHFNLPQDSEWAIDRDLPFPENVILLQTRPEVIAKPKETVDKVLDMMISRMGG